MKRVKLTPGYAVIAALALGCAVRAPTIQVSASDFDLNPLVGKWAGEYSSEETGRNGEISFALNAGEGEASGEIVMSPRANVANVVAPDRPMIIGVVAGAPKQLLTIHFVRKEGNAVIGLLDPYVDPDCACRVTTSFQGNFVNWRTIEGTYTTFSSELSHTPSHGNWKVALLKRL
jgi:hypothetical protein